MKPLFKNLLIVSALVLGILLIHSGAASAVDPLAPGCQGSGSASPVCHESTPSQDPVLHAINVTVNVFAIVTGIGAMIMILLGAFFYVTSAGNPENAAKARARILAALIGLVVIVLAWTIVHFVVVKLIK